MKTEHSNGSSSELTMYACPDGYCQQPTDVGVSRLLYNSCSSNRTGTLCGRCTEEYSESLFGSVCVPNTECGLYRWYVIILLMLYGVVYLMFFMFEKEWEHLLNTIYLQFRNCGTEAKMANAHSGYFNTFMYFTQTTALLQIELILKPEETFTLVYRPQDMVPRWMVDGMNQIFSFDVLQVHGNVCLIPDVTPAMKGGLKLAFVVYLYLALLLIYLFSGLCCRCLKPRPQIGEMGMDARMLCTAVALFLYTYQLVAENIFFFLNCTEIEGQSVLFYDANITCYQSWQYVAIFSVLIFVVPFFGVLLFAPTLLKSGEISLQFFFAAMVCPLFMLVPLVVIYFKGKKHITSDVEGAESEIVELLTGPYRQFSQCTHVSDNTSDKYDTTKSSGICTFAKKRDLCWEGVINFRRMLMILLFTFINDSVIRQICLSVACFVILLIHMNFRPFSENTPNMVESVSLPLLLIISNANLVKATLSASMVVPRGSTYIVVVVIEWLEVVCMGILPVILVGSLLVCMIIGIGVKAFVVCKPCMKRLGVWVFASKGVKMQYSQFQPQGRH